MLLGILISTIFQSFRVSIKACVLLIPYLIVCLILAIANYQIYAMNPDLPLLMI
jgi:tryptophan-rich sensory protein